MSNRVLLIGPNFHDFNRYIAAAYEELGWSVTLEPYDTPVTPYTLWNQLRYKLTSRKEEMREHGRQLFSEQVRQVFDAVRPELVFLVNGEMLLAETVAYMRQSSKVALWLFDSIMRLPYCWNLLPCCDQIFCYEAEDIPMIQERLSITASFLPQAVDPSAYHPLEGERQTWDLVFAADLWKSEKRQRLIQRVVASFPERKIRVWGCYKPWYKGLWRCLSRERRDVYTNRNASTAQLNLDYNRSTVVLNIHHEQQQNGANPKVYEIAASGSYQVCDANPYIESLFSHGEVGLYHDEEEMLSMIRWALDPAHAEERETKAEAARKLIFESHTFVHRMQTVLQQLGL